MRRERIRTAAGRPEGRSAWTRFATQARGKTGPFHQDCACKQARLRCSSLIWNDQTSLLAPCLACLQAATWRRESISASLNLFNKLETGHYYRVTQCREPGQGSQQVSGGVFFEGDDPVSQALNEAQALAVPTYPPGPHCNALGLTELGHQMIESLMRRGLLIETDHTSVESKEAIFALAESVGYPLISGHTGTGGITTETQKRRIFALGGLVSPFNNQAPALIDELLTLRELIGPETFTAAGFASDAGGLASQPAPRGDAGDKPLAYPFTSHDGAVRFDRQVTGERVYDLNVDGVAHYGQYADLLADMAQHEGGDQALEILFGAAEAYLQMWERAETVAAELRESADP